MTEARRRSEWNRDGFAGPGGHSANLKAWRKFKHRVKPQGKTVCFYEHDET